MYSESQNSVDIEMKCWHCTRFIKASRCISTENWTQSKHSDNIRHNFLHSLIRCNDQKGEISVTWNYFQIIFLNFVTVIEVIWKSILKKNSRNNAKLIENSILEFEIINTDSFHYFWAYATKFY